MDRKELALALDFKKAPKELQQAVVENQKAAERFDKAKTQILLWGKELEDADRAAGLAAKALKILLKSWEPDAQDPAELEEIKAKAKA